jgi:hypothetical protein
VVDQETETVEETGAADQIDPLYDADNKRIYVVVAKTVTIPKHTVFPELTEVESSVIHQPVGRIAAQVGHVVSRMRVGLVLKNPPKQVEWYTVDDFNVPVTTIVLSARDSKEMEHIEGLLEIAGLSYTTFYDTNEPVYGKYNEVLTAICTEPVYPHEVHGITDYLPLFKG